MSFYRKESVKSGITRSGDNQLPSLVAKLSTHKSLFCAVEETVYPFSKVLRLRVLQIVCGISILVMGSVAAIEEKGDLTNLAIGVPAGIMTVIAAGTSIHMSRGFGGYRASRWPEGSILRIVGPTPQTACPLFLIWAGTCLLLGFLFFQSAVTLRASKVNRDGATRFQLAIVELILSSVCLVVALEVLRIELRHDPD